MRGDGSAAGSAFLAAEWRHLVLMNWRIHPALLLPHVPRGTELDSWQGHHYISLVGFRFIRTRVLGIPIPFHRDFDEINLRFYVRRRVGGEIRRGVCFLRELVPRRAIALVARLAYNEPYRATATSHQLHPPDSVVPAYVEYSWSEGEKTNRIRAHSKELPEPSAPRSNEEFITEHYWGYTRQRDGGTIEYRVEHARWLVRHATQARVDGDLVSTYGQDFAAVLRSTPDSVLLADGSPVTVHLPSRIR